MPYSSVSLFTPSLNLTSFPCVINNDIQSYQQTLKELCDLRDSLSLTIICCITFDLYLDKTHKTPIVNDFLILALISQKVHITGPSCMPAKEIGSLQLPRSEIIICQRLYCYPNGIYPKRCLSNCFGCSPSCRSLALQFLPFKL